MYKVYNVKIPNCIPSRYDELCRICDDNPKYIPVPVAADFLGCDAEGLRFGIEKGTVPFGFCWQKPKIVTKGRHKGEAADVGGNRAFKIPTLKFYFWFMGQLGLQAQNTDS